MVNNRETMKVVEKGRIMKEKEHTTVGIASITLGLGGLILYFIGLFFFSFVDNRLYGMIIGVIFGIIAMILGDIARKKGDGYGTYGIMLGVLIVGIGLLTFMLTTVTTVETG